MEGVDGDDGMSAEMADVGPNGVGVNGGGKAGEDEKPELWDMSRPLVGNVKKLELLKFDDEKEAKVSIFLVLGVFLWGFAFALGLDF